MLRLADLVIRWRGWIIAATLLLTALLGWQALRVTLNGDFSTYLNAEDPLVQQYNRVGEVFGGNETGVVLVTAPDVFTADNLNLVDRLTDTYRGVEGVSDVISVTNVVDFRKTGWGLDVRTLVDGQAVPEDADSLAALRHYVLGEARYRGTLVSEDGTATAILVRFAGGSDPSINQFNTAQRVKAATETAVPSDQRPEGTGVYFGGLPFLVFNMTLLITENLQYLVPLMLLILVGVLLLGFRHWAGVVFPLLVVGVSTIWVVGLMGFLGLEFDLLTGIMPVVLLALGSADAIHLLKRYFERRQSGDEAPVAARWTFKEMGTPIGLTTITTMVGFGSLFISDFSVIRQFGLLTALGVLIALVVSLTLLPALLSYGVRVRPAATTSSSRLGLLDGLSTWVYHHKTVVLGGGALVALFAVVALPLIVKDVDWSRCLAKGSNPHHAEMLLREKFGGSLPVQIRVQGDLKDPAVLSMMRRIERKLGATPDVSEPQSMARLLAEMNEVLNGRLAVPETRQGVGNLWLLVEGEEVVDQMVAHENRDGLIQARLATWRTGPLVAAVDSVDAFLDTLPQQLSVVDLHRATASARTALEAARQAQVGRDIRWTFARYGVSVRPEALRRAVAQSDGAEMDRAARARVQEALRAYLQSAEAEIPLPAPTIRRVSETIGRQPGDLRPERIAIVLRRVAPTVSPEDADWMAGSLAEVARHARGEARIAAVLTALPAAARQRRDLHEAVTGALWPLNDDVIYLGADDARRILGSSSEALVRTVDWTASQTGMPPVLKQMEAELTPTQVKSLLMALGFAVVLLAFIFRSALGAVLAVVPISLTILVNFAVMGYAGIGLDAFTAMIASIAIGLGIDTDIHFVSRLREELKVDGSGLEALKRTVRTTGLSVLINAVAVGAGFLVLLGAGGQHLRRFGGLTSLTVFVSAALSLTLLAALLLWAWPRFLRRAAEGASRSEELPAVEEASREPPSLSP